jgi:DNA-binding PadR family transcriptional regulator
VTAETVLEPQSLIRACHEAVILAALGDEPRHGYQLGLDVEQRSEGQFRLNHGTLYPILHRLEQDGLIAGAWDGSGGGRKRKQYTITRDGRARLEERRAQLARFTSRLAEALGGWSAKGGAR